MRIDIFIVPVDTTVVWKAVPEGFIDLERVPNVNELFYFKQRVYSIVQVLTSDKVEERYKLFIRQNLLDSSWKESGIL